MMLDRTFVVRTTEREQILIVTAEVNASLGALTQGDGICTIVVPHTTCAISVNENADPDVPADLVKAFRALVPNVKFRHGEGNSDAHFLSTLIGLLVTPAARRLKDVLPTRTSALARVAGCKKLAPGFSRGKAVFIRNRARVVGDRTRDGSLRSAAWSAVRYADSIMLGILSPG